MKRKYEEHLNLKKRKLNFDGDVDEIHSKKRGRPLLICTELDSKVQKYIDVLRDHGAVINTQIVIAAAKGITIGTDKTLLVENGGSIEITKNWTKSLLLRMNFVKRRGSTACKNDKVENVDELKKEYLERIEKTVVDFDIPSNLVITWDHAGLFVVPVSNWTMAVEGSKRVEIKGLGDKRQITGVFAGTLSDRLQPLDVSVQKAVKNKMYNSFEQCYSNEIVKQLDGKEIVDSENEPIVPGVLSLTRFKQLSA
ncbi:unnamed protein product [Mytilus coruscus]|uniref:Uncharacterized protein n=1 Tax=Mytilus coruscus TaxID=42192 RepID=A0A6J8A715_MYTCO|nr:unnamed protein product [Mytilus coruscus]